MMIDPSDLARWKALRAGITASIGYVLEWDLSVGRGSVQMSDAEWEFARAAPEFFDCLLAAYEEIHRMLKEARLFVADIGHSQGCLSRADVSPRCSCGYQTVLAAIDGVLGEGPK